MAREKRKLRVCGYCGRRGTFREITFHHYYPRPHRNRQPRKHWSDGVYLCDDKHKRLHREHTNLELYEHYSSFENIQNLLFE